MRPLAMTNYWVACTVLVVMPCLAEKHVLSPVVAVRTTDGGVVPGEAAGQAGDGTKGNVTWVRFDIPEFPGERLRAATLDIGPIAQLNHPWDAGVQIAWVSEDAWSAESLAAGAPPTGSVLMNRDASDTGGTPGERVSTPVTDWLVPQGRTRVSSLSVRLTHTGGGVRGWWPLAATTLTITTAAVPTFPEAAPGRAPRSGIAVLGSLETVFPAEPPAVQDGPSIELPAAGRESESAQIAVVAGPESVEVTEVTASVLSCEGRALLQSAVATELVGYVTIREPSWRGWSRVGLWPDVLMPMRRFEVPAGQCRLIWVTVKPPAGTPPGVYQGTITIRYGSGAQARVPVSLKVRSFSLPMTPTLETSYWTDLGYAYPGGLSDWGTARRLLDLFSAYRTSTDTWGGITYWREADGRITCDWSATRRNTTYAVGQAGFRTINVSSGCWGGAPFGDPPVLDRATGQPLSAEECKDLKVDFAALYLKEVCDWLERQGWLGRAYLQLWDEAARDTWGWGVRTAYLDFRRKEPRLRLACVVGVHPELQELFDIWVPQLHFFDRETYGMAREGVSLNVAMEPLAAVTASSTGGWGNAAFYAYSPADAYDGTEYTKWTPAKEPTEAEPQWLRFDFAESRELEGIQVTPFGPTRGDGAMEVELSPGGAQFTRAELTPWGESGERWRFARQGVKSVRLVFRRLDAPFAPTDAQPVPPPQSWAAGVREVRFFGPGLPEGPLTRRTGLRPCTIWEYNVGADWPSGCIDARPAEHRATGWQCWERGTSGYLNYGAAQWREVIPALDLPGILSGDPPMIWDTTGNGGPNIIWPGPDGPLASIRFARFRDGLEDHDYLALLQAKAPGHRLLQDLRDAGRTAYSTPAAMLAGREELAQTLEELTRP